MPWYAGNLHCHSTMSDGDTDPLGVAQWYREHGYSFISLTDHNCLTPTDEYTDGSEDFIGIPGSEYTCRSGKTQTHVNGLGLKEKVPLPEEDLSISENIQLAIDGIRAQGGLAMVNHPCWLWSFGSDEMKKLKELQLFEVWNGSPSSNNHGDASHESTDEIWDALLSEGMKIFGVASDDAHNYRDINICPKGKMDAPGSGWIWVHAEELSSKSILKSIEQGNFIASNGVKLKSLSRTPEELVLEIEPLGKYISYKTTFVGKEGRVLSQQEGLRVHYTPRGDEGYVRARIESSAGTRGWVQPVFLD